MTFEEAAALFPDPYTREGFHKEAVDKVLAIPFDKDLHYPLIYLLAMLDYREDQKALLDAVPDKTDQVYITLKAKYDSWMYYKETNIDDYIPSSIPFERRWDGPHLDFPKELNGKKLYDWCPIRVNCVENGKVYFSFSGDRSDVGGCDCEETPERNQLGEIAWYGFDGDEGHLVKFHKRGLGVLEHLFQRTWKVHYEILGRILGDDAPKDDY